MLNSIHLSSIKLLFDSCDNELLECIMDTFRFSSDYTVESETLKDERLQGRRKLYWFVKDDDISDTISTYYTEPQSLKIKIFPERINSELSLIQENLDIDFIHDYIHQESYSRYLHSSEGRVKQFVQSLTKEIEELGYDVTHERSHGKLISDDDTTKEYKWWIYINNHDGSRCPHHVNIGFTENGPYLTGTVRNNAEDEERFRELLTDFSIVS